MLEHLTYGMHHFLRGRDGGKKLNVFSVLLRTLALATEHQYWNARGAAGKLGDKGRAGEAGHVEGDHYESEVAGEGGLIDKNESLCRS